MRKLFQVILAAAMVIAFLPMAQAGDSATLGLQVTFEQPLPDTEPVVVKITYPQTSPMYPFHATEPVPCGGFYFTGTAVDMPLGHASGVDVVGVNVYDESRGKLTVAQGQAEYDAETSEWRFWVEPSAMTPDGKGWVEVWAKDKAGNPNYTQRVYFDVVPLPVISIELDPTTWALDGVKLGELRENRYPEMFGIKGIPIHTIANLGGIPVMVDIGYGAQIPEGVHPGLEQGPDTFITGVFYGQDMKIIPPNDRIGIYVLEPDSLRHLLELTYGAPTELSPGIKNHSVTYEIRAYKAAE